MLLPLGTFRVPTAGKVAAGFPSFSFSSFLIENKHSRIHGYYYHVRSALTQTCTIEIKHETKNIKSNIVKY